MSSPAPNTAVATPGASPAPAAPPADHAGSPPAGSAAGSPPASREPANAGVESPNIRQLREQYETTKKALEPWERLGAKPEEVVSRLTQFQSLHQEALELGGALGYDIQEVAQLFQQDPVQVLGYLRQQAAQRQAQPATVNDLRRQMQQMLQEHLKPITAREDQRLNQEAESRFNGEFDRLFKESFSDGLPDEAKEALAEMVGQLVGDDPDACRRLKFEGQISDVGKYFEAAKTRFLQIVNSYIAHERKRTGQGPPPAPGQPPKPKSRMDATVAGGIPVRELFNI